MTSQSMLRRALTCAFAIVLFSICAFAQGTTPAADKTQPSRPGKSDVRPSSSAQTATNEANTNEPKTPADLNKPKDWLENVKFRNLGPAVGGGRVAAVTGVPGEPNIYYVGAAGGGVWKTVDGGISWKAVFEKESTASIGAIALAPSNPNFVWVGTGEANPRNDVITGKGIFFSPDGGVSWRFMGLENAGQISQIVVHPTNPDIVYVAVLGHVWGPNQDRGVFRTTDGGRNWQKVLYVDDKTGACDLVMDPSSPMVLFAGMWEVQRYPWMLVSGGQNTGIYRSSDGGATWKKLTEGLPKTPLGRIGLAVAHSNPNHVYALIEAKKGVLWDSTDMGEHWKEVSNDHRLIARGFYFTTLYVSPESENHIYFLSFNILESFDGGKSAQVIARGVHVDNHALWIDPTNPARMINGNDGGAYISADAGKTWRYFNNIPIEQFYMVATDGERPYMLCGGLQDNNGWCGPSNSVSRGGIGGAEWWTATGGDGEYIVPAGNKSGIVYADSQNGSIQRLDARTGMSDFIRPYLQGVEDLPPSELKYRFNWTSPIAVSPTDPKTLYLGGNVLFKSTDAGNTWNPVSPDLTRNDKSKQASSGGPVELDLSGAETFDTILSMSISPTDQNVIWVGTDDGLVQVTKDGGKTWANVTPKGSPEWGRLQQIEVSPFAPGTAYVALDYHELDNNKPYVFKTHDFGKTWTSIAQGLPASDPARVVRENPNKKGMLVLGTDAALFYSLDEGEHWMPLKSNFPTVPIYDLKFEKATHDLIVATHGRGLFIMDGITPLEETTPQVLASTFHLYSTLPAVRWHLWNRRGTAPGEFVTPNPGNGAEITYYLSKEIEVTPEQRRKRQTPVKIVVSDSNGQVIHTFYGPSKQGVNRAVWNMRYNGPTRLNFQPEREPNEFNPDQGAGPVALPGNYKVTVTVGNDTQTQTVELQSDPRFPFDADAARAQLRAALEVRDWVSALNESLNRVESLKSQVATVQKLLTPDEEGTVMNASYTPVLEQARNLQKKLNTVEGKIYNSEIQPNTSDRIHFLAKLADRVEGVYRSVVGPWNRPPNALVQEEMSEVQKELGTYLAEFNQLLQTDVASFNKLALEKGANTLFAGNPIQLKGTASQAGAGQ